MKDVITLQQIAENLSGHVYWKNLAGIVLGCNNKYAQDLGFKSSQDVIGKTVYELMPKDKADTVLDLDLQVMQKGKCKVVEENFLTKAGEKFFFVSQKTPLNDEDEKVAGMVNLSIDVTAIKKYHKSAGESEVDETAIALSVEQITEIVSHDLRIPLAGINLQADLIELALTSKNSQTEKDKVYRDAVKNIKKAIKDYLSMINDLSAKIRGLFSKKNR